MRSTYRLTRTWRCGLWVLSEGMLLLILALIASGSVSVSDEGFVWTVAFLAWMGIVSYGAWSTRIVTSSDGLESVSYGVRSRQPWDAVERVDINSFGFVNLVFKQPIYRSRLWRSVLKPLGYDRTLQLSLYIDDLGTSGLLQDIANFVPGSNVAELVATYRRGTKPYEKVGQIGIYYLVWLTCLAALRSALAPAIAYLEAYGLRNVAFVGGLVSMAILVSLLVSGFGLLGYNAVISRLNEQGVARKARAQYLSPIVALVLALLLGLGLETALTIGVLDIPDAGYGPFALPVFFLGAVSPLVAGYIEKIVFRTGDKP